MCYNNNMRILIYSDVHGNKYALEKLQETSDYKNADMKICLGDAVMLGPEPNECLQDIYASGDIFLLGNHDSYCAYGLPEEEFAYFKQDKKDHQNYMRKKTSPEFIEKLKEIPKEYYFSCFGKTFYFTHYRWETEKLVMDDPDEPDAPTIKTAELFKDIKADYIIFGHNHKPADFSCNGKRFICVGSLGMKYPGSYVKITIDETNINIKFKKIYFDVEKLKQEMLNENYPRALKYINFLNQD